MEEIPEGAEPEHTAWLDDASHGMGCERSTAIRAVVRQAALAVIREALVREEAHRTQQRALS
jgi:hypothetical protein